MKIFVDADACPVVRIVEEVAEKYRIDVTLLCDTNHILTSDYSEVIVVGAGADAVDYKLISICHKGDIVVSQDYGVARALGRPTAPRWCSHGSALVTVAVPAHSSHTQVSALPDAVGMLYPQSPALLPLSSCSLRCGLARPANLLSETGTHTNPPPPQPSLGFLICFTCVNLSPKPYQLMT